MEGYCEKLLNTPSLRDTPLKEGNENTPPFGYPSTEGNTKKLEDQIDLMDYKLTCVEARIVDPQIDKVLAQFG
ncbi:MAG: hypothetical protein JXC36_03185, partial [Candidatus Atribacteria bacterium]|nr:hypothetical protein [Candidatus Atribacteria bacterium]